MAATRILTTSLNCFAFGAPPAGSAWLAGCPPARGIVVGDGGITGAAELPAPDSPGSHPSKPAADADINNQDNRIFICRAGLELAVNDEPPCYRLAPGMSIRRWTSGVGRGQTRRPAEKTFYLSGQLSICGHLDV
jgi:hypothetical protein